MRVACVAVPHFLVAVERRDDPTLRGRPVVVGGRPDERKEVADCSVEAMARGVRQGMSLREALSRCPEAVFVEAHAERYRTVMTQMVSALLELSPLVELAGPGMLYVGIDGRWPDLPLPLGEGGGEGVPSSLNSQPDPFERDLVDAIVAAAERASGLQVRVGVADGKFVSYVAAMKGLGDNRTTPSPPPSPRGRGSSPIVPPGKGAAMVGGLSLDDLPVSAEMRRRLQLFGLRSVADLARLPKGAVSAQFGKEGARAWELARGVDRSPIVPYQPPRLVTERLAFS